MYLKDENKEKDVGNDPFKKISWSSRYPKLSTRSPPEQTP